MSVALQARLAAGDLALYRTVRASARHPGAIRAAQATSLAGEHAAAWLAGGALGFAVDRKRRPRWAGATVAVAGAHAVNVAVKRVVRRQRPIIEALPALAKTPSTLSFPSAHAASSFAAARAFSPLLGNRALYAAAVGMGFSRVYLGVHYPSDVAAGALLGLTVGSLARPRRQP